MPLPPRRIAQLALAASLALALRGAHAQSVFINELHYNNVGGDTGEFVEIAGPAGTSLADYSLVFYNGANSMSYKTVALGGLIPDEGSGFGAVAVPVADIQNGNPDGLALIDASGLVQFLSYGGTFVAVGGSAAGASPDDIGVQETGSTPIGMSLQLTGSGDSYGDFSWIGPSAESPGALNEGQTFNPSSGATLSLSVSPKRFFENGGAAAATATVRLNPAPAAPVEVVLGADAAGEVTFPSSVNVGASGLATFEVGAIADGESDGDQSVTLGATASSGEYGSGSAELCVLDSDPPLGRGVEIRVATFNVANGVGTPGSVEYEAVFAILRRLRADLIAFTEVDSAGDFADLKTLLGDLGFPPGDAHLATKGEGFTAAPFSSGDFGAGSQSIAIASRWPITRAAQIGRGIAGRREMTRYPLFVEIDIPGSDVDPAFVAAHLKAGDFDADNFRRLVEAYRIVEFLTGLGYSGADDPVFVLGDLNEDLDTPGLPASYFTGITPGSHVFGDGSTLPGSYQLGADLAAPAGTSLPYAGFPGPAFAPLGLAPLGSLQPDGASRTFNVIGDSRIDYILVGEAITGLASPRSEVYNSLLEVAYDGLPKSGGAPPAAASFIASDHHLVFADLVLEAAPRVTLEIVDGGARGEISVDPPPAADVEVALWSASGRLRHPPFVTVPAGGGAVGFPIGEAAGKRAVAASELRLTASAPGHVADHAFLAAPAAGASGRIVFSQYTDPPAGGSPRAVELVNASGEVIDFAEDALRVSAARDGGSAVTELLLRAGSLAAGDVLVVGDAATGDYLVAEGLLLDPGSSWAAQTPGTVFANAAGRDAFVYLPLVYNGDDALRVGLDHVPSDTFGLVGDDPGAAWSAGGVSTADQNLALRDDVATGSAGWTDPSQRFVNVTAGGQLDGFGVAPALDDPYIDWASALGLGGAAAALGEDIDRDGLCTLLEFALGGNPLVPDPQVLPRPSIVEVGGQQYLALTFRRRNPPGRLIYEVEVLGPQPGGWSAAAVISHGSAQDLGQGIESATLRLDRPLGDGVELLRLRVRLP